MSDWELLEKIKEYAHREIDPIPPKVMREKHFIDDPRNKELHELRKGTTFEKWNWQQVVRRALDRAESQRYMYDKLWDLLLKHRNHYRDYFEIDTEIGTFSPLNPLTRLNRIVTLYNEYFEIYKNITNHIHFDYPKKEYFGPIFRGKINWEKTLRSSNTEFPLNFDAEIPYKKFDTPGNILLLLCSLWLHKECSRILQLDFQEPLHQSKMEILETISNKTKNILLNFPFSEIIRASIPYWNLENDDRSILSLERESQKRFRHGLVRNPSYMKLLDWIKKFRNLNLSVVSEQTPTTDLLKSQVAQDTIYEAWIFFEFVDFFKEKGLHVDLDMQKKPYNFKFEYNGETITFYYEKEFQPENQVWAAIQKPDYTIMVNDEIIGIFDAKNYTTTDKSPAIVKMLSYMSNFNTKLGILFFPYLPEFWDDIEVKERRKKLIPVYEKRHPTFSKERIESMQKPESSKLWVELEPNLQKIKPPNSVKLIPNPKEPDMSLNLMRMEPSYSDTARKMKKQTIQRVFDEITKRIPIVIKS